MTLFIVKAARTDEEPVRYVDVLFTFNKEKAESVRASYADAPRWDHVAAFIDEVELGKEYSL